MLPGAWQESGEGVSKRGVNTPMHIHYVLVKTGVNTP